VTPSTGTSESVFYTFDERGNTVQRFDAAGNVLSTRATDAYGMTTSANGVANDPYDGFGAKFGYYTDAETGFVLCSLRYYDPKVGRWISRDPIGLVALRTDTPKII
jgi:RHS repeat-associated protein